MAENDTSSNNRPRAPGDGGGHRGNDPPEAARDENRVADQSGKRVRDEVNSRNHGSGVPVDDDTQR